MDCNDYINCNACAGSVLVIPKVSLKPDNKKRTRQGEHAIKTECSSFFSYVGNFLLTDLLRFDYNAKIGFDGTDAVLRSDVESFCISGVRWKSTCNFDKHYGRE